MIQSLDYNAVELAKANLAIASVIAGFSLTIVVLLLSRLDSKAKPRELSDEQSIEFFLTAFFVGLIAAFGMGEIASEPMKVSEPMNETVSYMRTFASILPAGTVMGTSVILLTLGIAHTLVAYNLKQSLWLAYIIHFFTTTIASAFFVSASGNLAEAGGHDKYPFAALSYTIIVFCIGLCVARYKSSGMIGKFAVKWFLISTMLVAMICAIAIHEILSQEKTFTIDNRVIFPVALLFNLFLCTTFLFLPPFRDAQENKTRKNRPRIPVEPTESKSKS